MQQHPVTLTRAPPLIAGIHADSRRLRHDAAHSSHRRAAVAQGHAAPASTAAAVVRQQQVTLRVLSSPVTTVGFSPSGILASAGQTSSISLSKFDFSDDDITLESNDSMRCETSIDQLAFDQSSGNRLATVSGPDKTLRIWDVSRRSMLHRQITTLDLYIVAWSPDGSLIATGSRTDVITIFDPRQNKAVRQKKFEQPVHELQWSPDSQHLAMASGGGGLGCINTFDAEFNPVQVYCGHTATCSTVRFDPVLPGRLASGGYDGLVALWSGDTCIGTIDRLEHPIRNVCYSPDGQFLFSASSDDKYIDMSLADTGAKKSAIPLPYVKMLSMACHPTMPLLVYFGDEEDRNHGGFVHAVRFPA